MIINVNGKLRTSKYIFIRSNVKTGMKIKGRNLRTLILRESDPTIYESSQTGMK